VSCCCCLVFLFNLVEDKLANADDKWLKPICELSRDKKHRLPYGILKVFINLEAICGAVALA